MEQDKISNVIFRDGFDVYHGIWCIGGFKVTLFYKEKFFKQKFPK